MSIQIVPFDNTIHRQALVDLWRQVFGYDAPHNDPALAIDKKLAVDAMLYVALAEERLIGSVMAGYDGHRGWIYSLAVAPDCRGRGVGASLLKHVETQLTERGCMKINLQVMAGNEAVEAFYQKHGYLTEQRISMGKRLPDNIP